MKNLRKKVWLFSLILLGIVLVFLSKDNCIHYKEYKFCPSKGGYDVYYNNKYYFSIYYPLTELDCPNINIDRNFFKGEIHINFNPNLKGAFTIVASDLAIKMAQVLAYNDIPLENLKFYCLEKCEKFPTEKIDCNKTIHIIIDKGSPTLKRENKCIYILGNESTIKKVYSCFVYNIFII